MKNILNLERRPWFAVNAKEGAETAIVRIFDGIDSWTTWEFINAIKNIDAPHIELQINSPGGSVYEGIAIRNALIAHPAKVTAVVMGLAASAASYIAIAADRVIMAPNSELMIHDASGFCMGWASDMSKMAEDLDRLSGNMASMYAAKAGGTPEQWRALMLAESWFSAEEAVEAGLADQVAKDSSVPAPESASASAIKQEWLAEFRHAGRRVAPNPAAIAASILPAASAARVPAPQASGPGGTSKEGITALFTDEQLTALRQSVGVSQDANAETVLAAVNEALAEQADPAPAAATNQNTVTVDRAALDELREQAAQGAQARKEQIAAAQAQAVKDAVATGRIAPAAAQSWTALLERDPEAQATLEGLPAGTIPVNEAGHVGQIENNDSEGDQLLATLFPKGS